MAFISEINFNGTGISSGEFVEATLGPGDDPADFAVSVYRNTRALHTNAGISGGQVTLSSLSGTPDPDNAAYTVYVIPVGIRNANSDADEGSGVALTDISAGGGVISFYSAAANPAFTATAGHAAGATSTSMLDHLSFPSGECVQRDINGNQTYDIISAGDAVLCITSDSRVKTLRGCVRGADLKVGDLVWTLDHG